MEADSENKRTVRKLIVLSGLALFILGAAGVENRGPIFAGLMVTGIVLMYIGEKSSKEVVKMFDEKKFFEEIDAVDTGNYGIRPTEMLAIYDKHKDGISYMMNDAFKYGFLKGQHAEKAKQTKKALQ